MTLIELLVSISVMGIIIGPITISMMIGLLSSSGTKERISDSAAAQLLSAYFVTDTESSKTVEVPTTVAATDCGGATGTTIVRYKWFDGSVDPASSVPAAQTTIVAYVDRETGDDGLNELWRVECDGTTPAPVERSSQRLVRSVRSTTLTCGSTAVACPSTASGEPDRVTLNVTVDANSGTNPSKADTALYDAYTFTLQAMRRETPVTTTTIP
jgi:hypothetical protein